MTKLINFSFLLVLLTFAFSSCTKVSPKEVTVRVDNLGSNAGDIEVLSQPGYYGMCWAGCTDYSYPITEQNYRWTADDQEKYGSEHDESVKLQIDGNDCTLDVGIRFYVDNSKTDELKHLVTKYPMSLNGIVDGLLYDITRGAIKSTFEGMDLDNVLDSLSSLMRNEITDLVRSEAHVYGITVVEVYDISGLNAPESVMAKKRATQEANQQLDIAKKVQASQSIEDQTAYNKKVKSARADSLATVIRARAQSEATRILNSHAPSNSVIQYEYAKKWNGQVAPGNNIMLLDKINK